MVVLKFWFKGEEEPYQMEFNPMDDEDFSKEFSEGTKGNVWIWLSELLETFNQKHFRYLQLEEADGVLTTIDLNTIQGFSVMYPEEA